MRTREQRMAVVGFRGQVTAADVFDWFTQAQRAEMVYDGRCGKLRVVVVGFPRAQDREAAGERRSYKPFW